MHILNISSIFVLSKRKTMTVKETYRTTCNGTEWILEEDKFGCALYLRTNGSEEYHFSGEWFRTVEEAEYYLDEVNRRVGVIRPSCTDAVIPADYYGMTGRYYGD